MAEKKHVVSDRDTNPDPITGEPGAHPIGTGVGAAAGGFAAGAAAGALGGPVGAIAGAVVGGILGGLAGKEVGEQFDPTEDAYWRGQFDKRPYFEQGADYESYRPAYQYGSQARRQHRDLRFEQVEPDLETGWAKAGATSGLAWNKARHAARDAWDRVERTLPGDADRDGK